MGKEKFNMALPRKFVRLFGFLVVAFIVVYGAYYFAHDFAEQCSPAIARVDPSKREEEPLSESWKDSKLDIFLSDKAEPDVDNKMSLNHLSPIKQLKGIREPESLDLDSPEDNKTDVHDNNNNNKILTPRFGAEGERGLGDSDDGRRSKERISMSKEGRYQPGKDEEGPGLLIPSKSFDNSVAVVKHLKDSEMINRLNYDIWRWTVGYTVDDMRIDKTYPNYPDERLTIDSLHVDFDEVDPADINGKYSHKVYGYLLPPQPGDYRFSIEMTNLTAAGSVELWLSIDANPLNMNRILTLEYNDLERPPVSERNMTSKVAVSEALMMDCRAHYFEFLEKAFDGQIIVDIKWMPPGHDDFVEIEPKYMGMAAKFNDYGDLTEGPALSFLSAPLPSNELQSHTPVHYVGDPVLPITKLDILPFCNFKASYTEPRTIKKYEGWKQVRESLVYPNDETWTGNMLRPEKTWWPQELRYKGNGVISDKVKDKILAIYTRKLQSVHGDGKVLKIHHMEETVNQALTAPAPTGPRRRRRRRRPPAKPPIYGSRFLIEMDVELKTPQPRVIHTSEYVYLPKDSDNLCHTVNFQWRRSRPIEVYFVIATKNLTTWVDHLIRNMEDIYAKTKDDHFELIVVDYDSEEGIIEEKLRDSSVNRWHVINETGAFSRSRGLQAGIDYVTNPDSIVMTLDMHLTIPPSIVEYVRRHTIQGKMACAPFFFRLSKGYTEINMVSGIWEIFTYGLFALYKSDWIEVDGFDVMQYNTTWGGEDADLLDRTLERGYEVFRVRYPGLVHYYHTKAGMWGVDGAKNRPR